MVISNLLGDLDRAILCLPIFSFWCLKGFSLQTAGDLRGFSLCLNGPRSSHLFFAYDTLLFCKAKLREVQTIQNILQKYELASG